jgi:nickel transport protein
MYTRKDFCAAIGAVFFLLFVLSRPGLAHRVNVFAYVEGDSVYVECSYSKSDRVRFGDIEVKNAATGKVYLTGKTDEKGNFSFPVPPEARAAKADLTILLRSGEGHQNDWIVKADEYLSATPAAATTPSAPSAAAASQGVTDKPAAVTQSPAQAAAPKPATTPEAAPMDSAALQAVVEAAVEKKIAPLRKILLDEKEKGPGLTEVFGGIGYLVGMAGLLAYARSRKAGCGS